MRNKKYCLEIANIRIGLQIAKQLTVDTSFQRFLSDQEPEIEIVFQEIDALPEMEACNLVTESNVPFSEFEKNGQYIRLFHRIAGNQRYAIFRQIEKKKWVCEYLGAYSFVFESIHDCFRHIAFERILFENQSMILHSSFIKINLDGKEEGILFTGISGIGKSTQADLWEKYEQASILNGDRTILKKNEGCWYGYGSPYAGSSQIYRNEGVPIRAIIVLQQAEEDVCVRLGMLEAFQRIYAGLTVNTWNTEFIESVLAWNTELCMEVPVFLLKCKPQQSAVTVLKKSLEQL